MGGTTPDTYSTGITIDIDLGPEPIDITVGNAIYVEPPLPVVRFPVPTDAHGGTTIPYTLGVALNSPPTQQVVVPIVYTGTGVRGVDWRVEDAAGVLVTTNHVVFAANETEKTLYIRLLNGLANTITATLVPANSSATLSGATIGAENTFTLTANPGADIEASFETTATSVPQTTETQAVTVVLSEPAIQQMSVRVKVITSDHPTAALVSEVIQFQPGDTEKDVTLSWDSETTVSNRSVLLRITAMSVGVIGTQDEHTVTITGQTVVATDITVPGSGPNIDEGETKDLVLAFAGPAPVAFNIAVSRSGTATPDMYSIAWPGLVDVFPVAQGATEFRLPITRTIDNEATGSKTLIFALAASTNGTYTLNLSSVTVNLLDDEANLPVVTFTKQNVTTRQGTSQVFTLTAEPAPSSPLTIAAVLGGNAPLGDLDITWPGGVDDEITFDTAETTVTVVVDPTDTGQTANVELTLALTQDVAFAPGQYNYSSMVIEPALPLTYDGDTTILYDQMPGASNTLVRTMIPIDPVDPSELPQFETVDGTRCASFPGPLRWDDKCDNVLVHVLAPHTPGDAAVDASIVIKPLDAATFPGSNQYWNPDLSGMQLEMFTNVYGAIYANIFDYEMYTRESAWCKESQYWARFEFDDSGIMPGLARPGGVVTTVRHRSDVNVIEFEFRLCFDIYNLADPEGPREYRSSSGGHVYTKYVKVRASTIPAGTSYGDAFEDIAQSGVSLIKQGTGANDWHRIDAGTNIIRSWYLRDTATTTQAQAEAAQSFYGFGYPSNGEYSAHKRPHFGGHGRYVPRFTQSYTRDGLTGRDALRQVYAGPASAEIQHAKNGTLGNGFHDGPGHSTGAKGFWHPYGEASAENGSSAEIVFTSGHYYLRQEMVHKMILSRYLLYRNAVGLTNYYTGFQISAAELAAINNGKMPWGLYSEDNDHRRQCPHFYLNTPYTSGGANTPQVNQLGPPNGDLTSSAGRCPTNRFWNQPGTSAATIIEPIDANPYVRAEGEWSFAGLDHCIRDFFSYEGLALHGELSAIQLVKRRAHFAMRCNTRFEVDPAGVLSDYVLRSECIPSAVATLNDPYSRKFWGGKGQSRALPSLQFIARGIGHMMHIQGLGGRFSTGSEREDMRQWSIAFAHLSDLRIAPHGTTDRSGPDSATHPAGIQGYPDDPCQFGLTDLGNNNGALPPGWYVQQSFMPAYAARGFGTQEYAFRPRSRFGTYESGEVVAYQRTLTGLLVKIFDFAYNAGEKRPPGWLITATEPEIIDPTGGPASSSPPDGLIGVGSDEAGTGRDIRPWIFRRATSTERSSLGCPGELNTNYQIYGGATGQFGPWIAAAMSFCRINGITTIPFSEYIRTMEEGTYEDFHSGTPVVYTTALEVANSILARISSEQNWISPASQDVDSRWPVILGEIQNYIPDAVAPPEPQITSIVAGDSSIYVEFLPGSGFTPLQTYRVKWRVDGGTYTTINRIVLGASARNVNITGLTNDQLYDVIVEAVEPQEGLFTESVEETCTPLAGAGSADAPQNFAVVHSSASAIASWDAYPTGAMIVLYSTSPGVAAQPSPTEAWFGTGATGGTIWGLVDGTTYYMVVVSRDTFGDNSAASEEWYVIPGAAGSEGPTAAPPAPGNIAAVPQDGAILVTWDPPA